MEIDILGVALVNHIVRFHKLLPTSAVINKRSCQNEHPRQFPLFSTEPIFLLFDTPAVSGQAGRAKHSVV